MANRRRRRRGTGAGRHGTHGAPRGRGPPNKASASSLNKGMRCRGQGSTARYRHPPVPRTQDADLGGGAARGLSGGHHRPIVRNRRSPRHRLSRHPHRTFGRCRAKPRSVASTHGDVRDGAPDIGISPMAASALGSRAALLVDLGAQPTLTSAWTGLRSSPDRRRVSPTSRPDTCPCSVLAPRPASWSARRVPGRPEITRRGLLGRDGWPGLAERAASFCSGCLPPRPRPRADGSPERPDRHGPHDRSGCAPRWLRAPHDGRLGLGLAVAAGVRLYLRWIERTAARPRPRAPGRAAGDRREIHDVVADYVTGIVVQAQAAQECRRISRTRPGRRRPHRSRRREALGSTRRFGRHLRGGKDGPLAPAATSMTSDSSPPQAPRRDPVPLHLDGLTARRRGRASIQRVVGRPSPTRSARHGVDRRERRLAAHDGELMAWSRRRQHPRGASSSPRPHTASSAWPSGTKALGARFHAGPVDGGLAHRGPAASEAQNGPSRSTSCSRTTSRWCARLPPDPRGNGIEVVGEATNGRGGGARPRLRPDVCLLDIRMPSSTASRHPPAGRAGRHRADQGRRGHHVDLDEYVRTAINGASGFLLKDAGAALLVEAVRAATGATRSCRRRSRPAPGALRGVRAEPRNRPSPRSPNARRTCSVARARAHQRGDRHRAAHLAQHRQDPPRQHPGQLGARNRVSAPPGPGKPDESRPA